MGSLLTVNREIDRLALACKNSYGLSPTEIVLDLPA